MRAIFIGIAIILAITVVVVGVIKVARHHPPAAPTDPKDAIVHDETDMRRALETAADQLNQRGPISVNPDVRFDRAFAGPGARLTYYYSLPKYSSGDLNPDLLRKNVEPIMRNQLCLDEIVKKSMNMGATFVFVMRANNGADVLRFEMGKGACR
jgi:hypothetical protein